MKKLIAIAAVAVLASCSVSKTDKLMNHVVSEKKVSKGISKWSGNHTLNTTKKKNTNITNWKGGYSFLNETKRQAI